MKKCVMESMESTGTLIRGINEAHTFSQDEQHSSMGVERAHTGTVAFSGFPLAHPRKEGASPSDLFQETVV